MQFLPIKTRPFLPPKDDIYKLFEESLPKLREGDILVITSKILGIHQGRCVPIEKDTREEKVRLALKEADRYVPQKKVPRGRYFLTIKDYTLIGASGVDKSNGNGYYILWPKNNQKLLKELRRHLKKKYKLKKLGIISTDSLVMPMRAGTVGISTGFYGFHPYNDFRGKPDIFGRKLKVTRVNLPDSLAGIANLIMGESNELTPMLIIRGFGQISFTNKDTYKDFVIHPNSDIYRPLLKAYRKAKK